MVMTSLFELMRTAKLCYLSNATDFTFNNTHTHKPKKECFKMENMEKLCHMEHEEEKRLQ